VPPQQFGGGKNPATTLMSVRRSGLGSQNPPTVVGMVAPVNVCSGGTFHGRVKSLTDATRR
jgi:hypothetical protein